MARREVPWLLALTVCCIEFVVVTGVVAAEGLGSSVDTVTATMMGGYAAAVLGAAGVAVVTR